MRGVHLSILNLNLRTPHVKHFRNDENEDWKTKNVLKNKNYNEYFIFLKSG